MIQSLEQSEPCQFFVFSFKILRLVKELNNFCLVNFKVLSLQSKAMVLVHQLKQLISDLKLDFSFVALSIFYTEKLVPPILISFLTLFALTTSFFLMIISLADHPYLFYSL
jgi:hypothetical protein